MVYTEKEFEQAKQNGEFGSAISYRAYLSFTEFGKKKAHKRARKQREEAYNRATSLYEVKFRKLFLFFYYLIIIEQGDEKYG